MKPLIFLVLLAFGLILNSEAVACAQPNIEGPDHVVNRINDPYDAIAEFSVVLDPAVISAHHGYVGTDWSTNAIPPQQSGSEVSFYFGGFGGAPGSFSIVRLTATTTFVDGFQYTDTHDVLLSVSY